ncbi:MULTISPECIES: peroxiredoxin-like family protein [Neptunomonas]|uniref:AhpC/TSA family protein n=1 Tax=Neptunomonas marina TaxID=1815562 RepID=A0A437Q680_9GAMM|nr:MULTISPECIES: peroxiredoxin-like family protein [Neptunomonas]RVU30019.1 AhpC/TSA family protein [Neptunomonas marina]
MTPLIPRQAVPALDINTLNGPWSLADQAPGHFTMIVFYRGLHCPLCKLYLRELNRTLDEFSQRGVNVIALSSDTKERAETAHNEWGIEHITLGYELSDEQAIAWGLYRSEGRGKTSIGIEEPTLFSEPGLFLVRPDGTLYWSQVSTMPFARPHFKEILTALDFAIDKGYPARGEVV